MSAVAELSEEGLTLLMAAVRLARDEQIRTVAALRSRLLGLFPGSEEQVGEALLTWANYERAKGMDAR